MILDSDHAIPLEVDYCEQSVNGMGIRIVARVVASPERSKASHGGRSRPTTSPTAFVWEYNLIIVRQVAAEQNESCLLVL